MKVKLLFGLLACLSIWACSIETVDKEGPEIVVGPVGPTGNTGNNGLNSLTTHTVNGSCITLNSGLDKDNDGVLQESEIQYSSTVCAINGFNSLLITKKEGNCITVCAGLDLDEDGELQENEITSSETVCSEGGQDGFNSLIRFEFDAELIDCDHGGFRVYIGLDLNRDDILQDSEITSESIQCLPKCPEPPVCRKEIVNTTHCSNGEEYVFWTKNIHTGKVNYFKEYENEQENKDGLSMQRLANNNLHIYGWVTNGEIKCLLDFTFKYYTLDGDGKEHDCYEEDRSGWEYWTEVYGYIQESNGSKVYVELRGKDAQMGADGNSTELEKGAHGFASWLKFPNNKADINITIKEICEQQ